MSGGVGGMKVPAMPVRCKSVDALLQEADGTSSRSSESRSSRHFAFTSSSAGESRAVVKPSPSAPGSSHGTPAAGSVHLDVAASASDADTEPYDDQYDALHSSSKQSHGHGARVDRPLGHSQVSHSHVVKDSGRVTRQSAAIALVGDPGVAKQSLSGASGSGKVRSVPSPLASQSGDSIPQHVILPVAESQA